MPNLMIVIGSTRPGRIGLPVARWFTERARAHGAFDIDVADLAEIALPFLDEPKHPRLREYEHDHTKAWSARVDAADAYAFVTPEYNFSFPAPLKNALDFVSQEWKDKPATIVSYGGVSAGLRSASHLKEVLQSLGMTVVNPSVSIPFVRGFLGDDGAIHANEQMDAGAAGALTELARMELALRSLRAVPREG